MTLKSRIKVVLTNTSTTVPLMLVIVPIPSHTPITTALAYLLEQTYTRYVPVSVVGSQNSKILTYDLDAAATYARVDSNVPMSYMLE